MVAGSQLTVSFVFNTGSTSCTYILQGVFPQDITPRRF